MSNEKIASISGALLLVGLILTFGYAELYPTKVALRAKTATTLEETGRADTSKNPEWWLNSGAYLYIEGDAARTIQGRLAVEDEWRKKYAESNPIDTENGFRPQNIFRLLSKRTWRDVEQTVYFRILSENDTKSPRRSPSNGFLLYQHFKDGDNTYYAGLRLNGSVIIMKKANGVYYTLASLPFFVQSNRDPLRTGILPIAQWIGLKTETENTKDGVRITLLLDPGETGTWVQALEVVDAETLGGVPIPEGRSGIRSDFLDIEIKNYAVSRL
jgi:hypothetical protein